MIATTRLILSIFPGIDGLGRGFQAEMPETCVVHGPDLLWGWDIRGWHAIPGHFWGIVGGPPCQIFTALRRLNPKCGQRHGNQIPQFERIVSEAQPEWFLMENVPAAPEPVVSGYFVHSIILNNRWLGEVQERTRRFSFGTRDGRHLIVDVALFEAPEYRQAVTSSARAVPVKLGPNGKVKRTYVAPGVRHGPDRGARLAVAEMATAQGFPPDFLDDSPFTTQGKRKVIGNAVPDAMARTIARAIRRAMEVTP